METSEIGTLEEITIWPKNPATGNRRRGPLKSRTVDTLLHILSICYADSSHIIQTPDKGGLHIVSVAKDDIPINSTDIIPDNSSNQEETNVDETRMVSVTQEEGLCNTQVEPSQRNDLSSIVDTNPSNSINIQNQDTVPSTLNNGDPEITISVTDMMISSPNLPTEKDVEEGEISGEFMNLMPEDDDVESVDKPLSEPAIEQGFDNNNKSSHLSIDIGNNMSTVITKTKRNLVDYSEIALPGKSKEAANLERLQIKNQDFASLIKDNVAQNNKKRQGSCIDEKRTNKKAKKSVDQSTFSKDPTTIGENASQHAVNDSANKDVDNEKKKKRGGKTAEKKEKKKKKDRIKRAEKNRKLGVKRLKLQPFIKEKKIKYCRHYMKGRCHEGENCKFSHDMVPLTKSKPCCHFARHSCMKGDDCPFDHQLSKYPCNNYLSTGFCTRGSDCMFSHEAQPSDPSTKTSNDSKPQQKPPNNDNGSSPKKITTKISPNLSTQTPKGVNFISSREKMDTKSCPIVTTTTPKLSTQPPKGISFFTQEKLPQQPVNSEASEITKTPPVVPRGINFLSFGKKPGSDGFSLKIGKSPLGKVEGKMVILEDGVKGDSEIGKNDEQISSRKPMPVLPFLSSTSQRTIQSTLAFASKFDFGVKTNKLGI